MLIDLCYDKLCISCTCKLVRQNLERALVSFEDTRKWDVWVGFRVRSRIYVQRHQALLHVPHSFLAKQATNYNFLRHADIRAKLSSTCVLEQRGEESNRVLAGPALSSN